MDPFLTIARAEWRLLRRRRSYALLLAAFALLVALAAGLGVVRQDREDAQQAHYQSLVREQWDGQPARHPHRVAHYGTFAFKPVGPLAAFDPGVESFTGRVQFLEAHRQNSTNFAEGAALSPAFRFGELSPAFALLVLLPLITLTLGHRTLANEIVTGRNRLLLSQGVSLRTLALGKAAGLALALLPFLAVGAAAGATAALLRPVPDAELARRALLIGGVVLLHTAGWMLLSVWVSQVARTPARALGLLVGLWGCTCVILPRGAAAFAAARHPLPTTSEFNARLAAEIRQLGDSHNPNDPTFSRLRTETLARHGVERVEDLPVNYGAVVMTRGEELSAETFARHYGELVASLRRQDDFLRRTALLAPLLGARALSSALSGTDLGAFTAFQQAAEAYRYDFVQRLNALHRDKIHYENDREQRLAPSHWREIPDFASSVPPVSEALRGQAWSWAALGLWIAVPLLGLLREGRRP